MSKRYWLVYAEGDEERENCLSSCRSLKEARKDIAALGFPCVIETGTVENDVMDDSTFVEFYPPK